MSSLHVDVTRSGLTESSHGREVVPDRAAKSVGAEDTFRPHTRGGRCG
jgi:hypothetical protein